MKLINRLAATTALTALAVGGGTTVASAYSISGGAYSSTPAASHALAINGSYFYRCSSVVFSGVATGADTTAFTPSATGCTFMGFPTSVTYSGAWNLKVTGTSTPSFTGELEIPAGATMTVSTPIMGCTFVIAGPQTFQHGVGGNVVSMANVGTGVHLTGAMNGIVYSVVPGCPFPSGTTGVYNTNGVTAIPGITIS